MLEFKQKIRQTRAQKYTLLARKERRFLIAILVLAFAVWLCCKTFIRPFCYRQGRSCKLNTKVTHNEMTINKQFWYWLSFQSHPLQFQVSFCHKLASALIWWIIDWSRIQMNLMLCLTNDGIILVSRYTYWVLSWVQNPKVEWEEESVCYYDLLKWWKINWAERVGRRSIPYRANRKLYR